ncbi:2-keto-4-pentenoate hydratase [soil metagenome]
MAHHHDPLAAQKIASSFCEARAAAAGFDHFPGPLPASFDEAYAIQLAAINAWPDSIAGWKVGRASPDLAETFGIDRFIGPIFARSVMPVTTDAAFPIFVGGFAAFEAEFIIRLADDAPLGRTRWSASEAAELVAAIHIGVEVAGSPLSSINDLGTLATIAGFGNNNGLLIGPAIPHWRDLSWDALICRVTIDDTLIAQASAAAIPGSPMAALAFAIMQAEQLGMPLKAGALISTGAVTGVHPVHIGQSCQADFGPQGAIHCMTIPVA